MSHISSTQAIPEHTAVPRHVAVIMDGNGRWAKKTPDAARNGAQKRAGRAGKHLPCLQRCRRALSDRVRLFHRKLVQAGRRSS